MDLPGTVNEFEVDPASIVGAEATGSGIEDSAKGLLEYASEIIKKTEVCLTCEYQSFSHNCDINMIGSSL